jgi:hypothetical protein
MAFCYFCYSVEVFPTLVGMNRGEGGRECRGLGAPHTYEDEPNRRWTSLVNDTTQAFDVKVK